MDNNKQNSIKNKNKSTSVNPKTKTKVAKTTTGTTPSIDLFTTICKSNLSVECVKEYKFHPERKWRFDYAIPKYKIALEVEGGVWTRGRHTRPKGFLSDMEKYNTATLYGWRVFRTTPNDLYKTSTLNLIKTAINTPFLPCK